MQAARLCLDIIEATDPKQTTQVSLTGELGTEAIGAMGFRELLSVAQAHGIDPSSAPKGAVDNVVEAGES